MCGLKSHLNVVQIHGIVVDQESKDYSIVVQFCAGGSLDTFLPKSFKSIDEYTIFKFAYGTAQGMKTLADAGIVHRDLAARNILLDEHIFPRISDFGYSRTLDMEEKGRTQATIGSVSKVFAAPSRLQRTAQWLILS